MSNGSEHMPERCVHAPDGPDWAGLREPSSWKERALAAEEDRDELRRALDDAIGVANKNKIALDSAEAERDALRTQLDAVCEALTKDRVIMVTRYNGYTREDYSNPLVSVTAIEAALTEGAPDGQ